MYRKRTLSQSYDAEGEFSHPTRQKPFHHDLGEAFHRPEDDSPYARYTVAWICALPLEMGAARAMLDEFHETPAALRNDTNTYLLGKVKQHNVVIACLPQYGTNNAAIVLTNLMRTFPSIQLGLMVGIGGGVPSKADLRLGDIVVGTRVMQYDVEKIQDEGIRREVSVKTPSHLCNTAVANLRGKYDNGLNRSLVPSILQERLGANTGYGLPNSPDRLFAASYKHISAIPSCDGCIPGCGGCIPSFDGCVPNCDGCEESKLVPRTERLSRDPVIHYGAIASGNKVMKSGVERDYIAHQLDTICFEMEAAGLMDVLPCLPIRGICDYSDSHKNKQWQKYAAAVAAAYARELLEILPNNTKAVTEVPCMLNTSCDLSYDRRLRVLESLKYEQIDARKLTIKSAHAKTCRWFLRSPEYQAWLNSEQTGNRRFLWIRGKPGAGKSTLMKFIYLQTKESSPSADNLIASFFFNARGNDLEKSISGMYRSLLLQLFTEYSDLQTVLDNTDLVSHYQNECFSLNIISLKELFCKAILQLHRRSFTCFIDALDECDEQQVTTMIQDLEDLVEISIEKGIQLRICFSSRHYPYITVKHGIELTLEDQPGHTEDLGKYTKHRLQIGEDKSLAEYLHEHILSKAAGVFLWVVLVVDILNSEFRQRGRMSLKKRLKELPNSLSELFKDMLKRNQGDVEDLLLSILWILCAKRPLTPEEYHHAIWSGLYAKDLADDDIPAVTEADAKICIISSSKGLAEITKSKQPTVQFIHESVRDFLIKDKGLYELWPDLGFDWEAPSHERLKECCITYMNHPSVYASVGRLSDTNTRIGILNEYPFLEYASQNVLSHANSAALVINQSEFLSTFVVTNWIRVNNLFEKFRIRRYKQSTGLLYILAEKNLADLIRIHPKRECCLKVEDERYGPPILAAMAVESHDAVRTFFDILAEIHDAQLFFGRMFKEYSENSTKGVGLGRNFKFSAKKILSDYLDKGYNDLTFFFLQNSIDCGSGSNDKIYSNLLLSAARVGDEIEIRRLLGSGVDLEVKDSSYGQTPLLWAVRNGHTATVELLVGKGADLKVKDSSCGQTPLSWAAGNGHTAIVELLVDKGADLKVKDSSYGQTPLSWAARNGHTATVELLVGKGTDLEVKDSIYGQTPLSWAAGNGHTATVELLVGKGADLEVKDNNGQTPLLWAARNGHTATVELLSSVATQPP